MHGGREGEGGVLPLALPGWLPPGRRDDGPGQCRASVAAMPQAPAALQLATEGLDAEPFAQQHCVQQGQQLALHGVATTSNQVATPPEALLARLGPVQTFPLPAAARASSRWRSLRPAVILKALACPLWLMPGWSLQPKTPWRTTPASPGKTLLWLMAALRQRAGLVRQVDAGLLATAGRQPVQGQQQVGQQAHKWATSGECCKAGPVLAPEDLVPALLAVLVGREGEQHQDGQHLAAGELVRSPAPAP